MKAKSESDVAQSCPTTSDPMDCSLPRSSIHGIFQARVLKWLAIVLSGNTWSNRQMWPWSTEWSRAKANRFCQENTLVTANTLFQQHKRGLYTWTWPDGHNQNQIDYILCNQRWRSSIQSAKTRLGVDCGSDHELLVAKFRLKMKKVGKTTRLFKYDLNQIPYDYTVEMKNRFKGLDLIDKSAWWTMDGSSWHCTGKRDQDHPQEKKCKKSKWLPEEALQIAVKRTEAKSKGEKERYTHLNAEFQKIARRDKKAFLSDQCKEIEENKRIGKTDGNTRPPDLPLEKSVCR